jgi:hypothetical protein
MQNLNFARVPCARQLNDNPGKDRGEMQTRSALTLTQIALIGAIRRNWRNIGALSSSLIRAPLMKHLQKQYANASKSLRVMPRSRFRLLLAGLGLDFD